MAYMRVLFVDISVVHSMLNELSPRFVICHRYDEIGNLEQTSRIGDFIAPNRQIADLVSKSLVKSAQPHTASNESLPFKNTEDVAARLQIKLDAIESTYC